MGCDLGPSGLSVNTVSECENVIESLVLEGVWADIDHTVGSSDAGVDELLMGDGGWVDVDMGETVLSDSSGIDMLEGSDFLADGILLDFHQLPSEVDINSSLVALFEGDLVGISEFIDVFIWGEICDSCRWAGNSEHLIVSEERFVVKGPEVVTLSLMWGLGRIAEHIAVAVVPSVVVVLEWSIFIVEDMNEAVILLWQLLQLRKTLDQIVSVIESGGNDQSFVGILLVV